VRGFLVRRRRLNGMLELPNPDLIATGSRTINGVKFELFGLQNPLRVKAKSEAKTFELFLNSLNPNKAPHQAFTEDVFPRLAIYKRNGIRFLALGYPGRSRKYRNREPLRTLVLR
jgi:hypothetical protein